MMTTDPAQINRSLQLLADSRLACERHDELMDTLASGETPAGPEQR